MHWEGSLTTTRTCHAWVSKGHDIANATWHMQANMSARLSLGSHVLWPQRGALSSASRIFVYILAAGRSGMYVFVVK